MPHCPVSPRPHSKHERVLELLWFHSSPQELVFAERETKKKGITFPLHQATLMPLDRKEQETHLCVEKEGKGRKWNGSRGHPPHLTGPAPIPLQLSPWEAPAFALLAKAAATSNGAENRSQGQWVLIPPLS